MDTTARKRSDLGRMARGSTINMAGAGISGALGFVLSVVLARGLGVDDAGIFFEVIALYNILEVVGQAGAPSGLVRMIARDRAVGQEADVRPTIWVATIPVLVVSTAMGLFCVAAAPWITDVVMQGGDSAVGVEYLRTLAPFMIASTLAGTLARAFQGFGQMMPVVALTQVLVPVLRTVLCTGVLIADLGPAALGLAWGLPSLVSLVVAIPWLGGALHRDEARREPAERRPVPVIASEFWRFTIYQALATIVQIVLLRLDVLLVGGIENSKQAGIYSAASRYLTPGVMFATAIVFVVGPQLAGMIARKDFDRALNVYQTATLWLSVLSFPMYIALAVYATLLMRIFGPGFSAGATALQILSIAMLLNMATGAVRSALFMGGKSSWILWDNTAALVSNIALNVILIPEFGINGAAVAWAVSIAIGNLLPLYQVKGLWGLQPVGRGYLTAIAASVLCFGVLGLVFRAALGDSIPAFIAYAVVSSAIYCVWAWRSRRLLQIDAFGEAVRLRRSRSAQA